MSQELQEPMTFAQIGAMVDVRYDGLRAPLVEQLDRALQKASKHLGSKKGASAEFTLKVKMKKNGDDVAVAVLLEGKESNPAPFVLKAYLDKFDRLVAEDPTQQDLPLEVVPRVASEQRQG